MRSVPVPAANFKCRGKKTRLLTCGCCVLVNFKDQVKDHLARKEINDFRKTNNAELV